MKATPIAAPTTAAPTTLDTTAIVTISLRSSLCPAIGKEVLNDAVVVGVGDRDLDVVRSERVLLIDVNIETVVVGDSERLPLVDGTETVRDQDVVVEDESVIEGAIVIVIAERVRDGDAESDVDVVADTPRESDSDNVGVVDSDAVDVEVVESDGDACAVRDKVGDCVGELRVQEVETVVECV